MYKQHLTMSQLFQIRFLIGILLACLVHASPAVESYTPTYAEPVMEPWRWQVYDDPDFRDAQCLFKASNGVLWIGSLKGVVCYDGKTKTKFENNSFSGKGSKNFFETSDGTLYYCTSQTAHIFKHGKWTEIYAGVLNNPQEIKFLIVDSNDTVWLGLTIGMLQIEKDERTLWVPRLNFNPKMFNGIFNRVCVIGSSDSIELNKLQVPIDILVTQVETLVGIIVGNQGKEGSFWLATRNQHLYYLNPGSPQEGIDACWSSYIVPKSIRLPRKIVQIREVADGSVWVIGHDPVYPLVRFDPSRNEWKSLREEIPFVISNFQGSITQSQDGAIWICGENSLLKYKNEHWQQFKGRDLSFSESEIIHLMAATDHSLWLTFRKKGIARLDLSTDRWLTYEGLHFEAEGTDGSEWFISADRRIVQKQADQWRVFDVKDGLVDFPRGIFITRSGIIWAYGRHKNKAAVSWFVKGQWRTKVCENFAFELSPDSVFENQDGTLWFGAGSQSSGRSHTGGLLRCSPASDGESMAFKIFSNPLGDHYRIGGIARDFDGTILAGGQLKRLKQGKLEAYREEGMPPRMIHLLQEGQKCWMLTGRFDLLLKEGSKRTLFKSSDSSLDREIYSFLSWNSKTLWAGTDRGIYYFDGSAWTQQSLHSSLVRLPNICGLRSNREDTLWINLGRNRNAVRFLEFFRSIRHQKGTHMPETRMIQSPSDGRHYQAAPLSLEWDGSDLWNQTPTAELHYSYRLNQGAWSPFSAKTQQVFSDLAIGKQHFEVRARNRDLNIDPTPATISFIVVGPLWLRPWFIFVITLLIATIIYLFIRLVQAHNLRTTEGLKFEKEQAEQNQKLDHFRLEFFTNISHELRTPLTLILGPLEQLAAAASTPNLKEKGQIAQRNAYRLLTLVNQLLDMRKLQEGKFKLEATQGNISQVVDKLIESFKFLASKKSVTIIAENTAEPLIADFDPDKLEKIITNLLSNAIKFTPCGGKVLVRLETKENTLYIMIEDNGPGIDPTYQHHIFERFAQVPSSSSDRRGTGIGLALTRELVELHGGTIGVESPIFPDTASGSRFTIQLPILQHLLDETFIEPEPEIVSADPEPEEPLERAPNVQEKYRILVIEDNLDMRRFIGLELETSYTVLEAEDGEQGVEVALETIPDLIISDVMMPKMDGFEVCATLKENLLTSHIPIILLTARGSLDAQVEGFETGVDDYMVKPFNSELLKVRVRNLLELRQKLRLRFAEQIHVKPTEVTISTRDAEFLEKAIRVVKEHIDDPDFNSDMLSIEIGVSKSVLYRKIKAITGQSVNLFIRSIRLKKAAQLLIEGEIGVGDISFRVGFSSHNYFTRCFTQEFGKPPSAFCGDC